MGMIELSLPYPPTGNHAVKHTRNGHYATKEAKAYRAMVIVLCRPHRPKKPLAGPLWVVAEIFPPDRRRRDSDNVAKVLLDCLTHAGIWEDDSQIADLRLIRRDPVPGGSVAVRVGEIEGGGTCNSPNRAIGWPSATDGRRPSRSSGDTCMDDLGAIYG